MKIHQITNLKINNYNNMILLIKICLKIKIIIHLKDKFIDHLILFQKDNQYSMILLLIINQKIITRKIKILPFYHFHGIKWMKLLNFINIILIHPNLK
jgi:hypothetical protein